MSHADYISALTQAKSRIVLYAPDAARLNEYFDAKIKEAMSIQPPAVICAKESILSVDENGTAYIKPPRSVHRSRIVRLLDRITRWIDPQA
jgi:hypothetical protein